MRWEDQPESTNIEDRRGRGLTRPGLALTGGGLVLVLLVSFLTGTNPLTLLNMIETTTQETASSPSSETAGPSDPPKDQLGKFAAVVLRDTEVTWTAIMPKMGRAYQEPRLVLFTQAVRSTCGLNSSAVGPFYCPRDEKVYLDLSFFNELANRFGAPGDFAQAYVIAHEVGHHVQNLLGIAEQVTQRQQNASNTEANALSVRVELQADCLAGVWAFHATDTGYLTQVTDQDIAQSLDAAASVGDDRIQRETQGYVSPESWTHGSSEQRQLALKDGLQSGDIATCDSPGWTP